jgi:hypothetical protein
LRSSRILAALSAACLAGAAAPASAEIYRWVEYGPNGAEARATTDAATCPALTEDGVPAAMAVRAAPGPGYPMLACSAPLPATIHTLEIDGLPVAVPVAEPRRIAIIGDSGCRVAGTRGQACNDAADWPFRLVAETAAALRPDAVIHVGDYHYRESACPAGNRGCAGSPFGDNWAVWRADFFAPAETLLRVAPWVVVRGNHEECDRGGQGWSRTLDPYPFDTARGCNAIGAPYAVMLGALRVGVMDVSTADEDRANPTQVEGYRAQFVQAVGLMGGQGWLAMHRPIWNTGTERRGVIQADNPTLAAAAADQLGGAVQMLLSGHRHTFSAINYDSGLPPQLVAGHGGDDLDRGTITDPTGRTMGAVRIVSGINMPGRFGFVLAERDGDGWTFTNRDVNGRVIETCRLANATLSCTPAS